MARAPKKFVVDPDATYRVTLKRSVRIGRTLLRPNDKHFLGGRHLEANIDSVASYEAI